MYYLLAATGGIWISEVDPTEHLRPFYWQAGATVGAILVAISGSATIFIGMNGLVELQKINGQVYIDKNSEVRNQKELMV